MKNCFFECNSFNAHRSLQYMDATCFGYEPGRADASTHSVRNAEFRTDE
jgi:hypothetical protein